MAVLSGGHWNYFQVQLKDKAREIRRDGRYITEEEHPSYGKLFLELSDLMFLAETLMTRLDWVESGDDSLETLQSRFIEDTGELKLATALGKRVKKALCKSVAEVAIDEM